MLNETTLQLTIRMLKELKPHLSNAGSNDYELPGTRRNIEWVRQMINQGDYPKERIQFTPQYMPMGYVQDEYRGRGIMLMDWQIVNELIAQLEQELNSL